MATRSMLVRNLAGRIDRLKETFEALNGAVREKVAEILGKTVEDFVRQAIRKVLEGSRSTSDVRDSNDEEYHESGRSSTYRQYPPQQDVYEDEEEDWRPRTEPKESDGGGRLATAVAVGCRAAEWWLSRKAGRRWWSATVGVVAGAAAYLGGPVVAALLPAAAALSAVDGVAGMFHALNL